MRNPAPNTTERQKHFNHFIAVKFNKEQANALTDAIVESASSTEGAVKLDIKKLGENNNRRFDSLEKKLDDSNKFNAKKFKSLEDAHKRLRIELLGVGGEDDSPSLDRETESNSREDNSDIDTVKSQTNGDAPQSVPTTQDSSADDNKETQDGIGEKTSSLELRLVDRIVDTANALRVELGGRITGSEEGLGGKITSSAERLEGKITSSAERLEGKITSSAERLEGKITSSEEKLEGKITRSEEKLEGKITSLEKKLEGKINTFKKELRIEMRWCVGLIFSLLVAILLKVI